MDEDYLSECCGAESTVEVIDGLGVCADCHEHAEFTDDSGSYESPTMDERWQDQCEAKYRDDQARRLK